MQLQKALCTAVCALRTSRLLLTALRLWSLQRLNGAYKNTLANAKVCETAARGRRR